MLFCCYFAQTLSENGGKSSINFYCVKNYFTKYTETKTIYTQNKILYTQNKILYTENKKVETFLGRNVSTNG